MRISKTTFVRVAHQKFKVNVERIEVQNKYGELRRLKIKGRRRNLGIGLVEVRLIYKMAFAGTAQKEDRNETSLSA